LNERDVKVTMFEKYSLKFLLKFFSRNFHVKQAGSYSKPNMNLKNCNENGQTLSFAETHWKHAGLLAKCRTFAQKQLTMPTQIFY
jgi:hypothetical protein